MGELLQTMVCANLIPHGPETRIITAYEDALEQVLATGSVHASSLLWNEKTREASE